jgi:hypothetical protein
MPLLIPILAAAGILFFVASKKSGPGGISSQAAKTMVPVVMGAGDEMQTKASAVWRATAEQNQLFGPRSPAYWSVNGYFMFPKASGGGYDKYKPDWQVEIVGSYV